MHSPGDGLAKPVRSLFTIVVPWHGRRMNPSNAVIDGLPLSTREHAVCIRRRSVDRVGMPNNACEPIVRTRYYSKSVVNTVSVMVKASTYRVSNM